MAKHLRATGLAFRVALYFGRQPEEELTGSDIAVKFDVPAEDVGQRLSRSIRDGVIARKSDGPGRGHPATYSAGPILLQMLGLAMEACAPSGAMQVSAGGG